MQNKNSNLWQSLVWEKFQKELGQTVWLFKKKEATALVVKHNLKFGYAWLDIPKGPIGNEKQFEMLLEEIITKTKNEKIIFIRIMPKRQLEIRNLKFKIVKAHANYQPETTLKLDLNLSEEELLKQMKPKGRYNIRLAQKKGVKIIQSNNVKSFYKILQETTKRDTFQGHSLNYYQKLLDSLKNQAVLLLAEYQDKIIAGGIFIFTKKEGIYYYGASSNQHRAVMAPYLLQWKAIKGAKKRGCKFYDFLGIMPDFADSNHPWQGVTAFKKKFGGKIINYSSAQEIILCPFSYKFLILAKKLKKHLHW